MESKTRDPFGLGRLPGLQAPADGWNAIASELHSAKQRQKRWIGGLAIAATVMLAAGLGWLLPMTGAGIPSADPELTPSPMLVEQATATEPGNLEVLMSLSQRLEQNLLHLRSGVGAMPAEMVVYQVELEDLVAQVDAAISLQPDSSELWRQRVNLLMDLNQVYGAGLRRDEPYVASL